jgi:hypothetical protein
MEELFWLLVIGYFFFGNALRKGWRHLLEKSRESDRARAAQQRRPERLAEEPLEEEWIGEDEWLAESTRSVSAHEEKLPPPLPSPVRRRSELTTSTPARIATPDLAALRRLGLSDRRDLRRAIVLMTVLGPCRANESAEAARDSRPAVRS